MPVQIPFVNGNANHRLETTIDGDTYLFDVRWNGTTEAWYVDVRESDETLIAAGLKLVLGTYIGRTVQHRLFREGVVWVIDTSQSGQDAGLADLAGRVQVRRYTLPDVFGAASKSAINTGE